MVQNETAAQRLQNRLQYFSRTYSFVGPLGSLAPVALAELIFTNYYSGKPAWLVIVCIGIVLAALISRFFLKNVQKKQLAAEYIVLNLVEALVLNFLVPLPSPYMIANVVIPVLIYFDFDITWAGVSLLGQSLLSIVVALARGYNLEHFLNLLNYIFPPAALAIFIVALIRISKQETKVLSRAINHSLAKERQTDSLINNITDAVIAVDQHLKITVYNASALDILDSNISIQGKTLSDVLRPIDKEHQEVDVGDLLKSATVPVINRDLRIKYKDGSIANLYMGISPIYLGYSKSANNGYTLIIRDITREKSLEEERDEFISVVSHELRTPIAIAEGDIGNALFMADRPDTDSSIFKTALTTAHNQVLFLADMINDLATLSRAERGKLEIEVEEINVTELMNDLGRSYTPQAKEKGLDLKQNSTKVTGNLYSSKLYVREILQNFITNAIKYTEAGSVTIIAETKPKGTVFHVKDTGIGISKSDQERVYDKFFRAEDFRTRKANGTGLGLYVTLKLSRMLHAELDLESELNKGSTFQIFIPNLKK